MSDCLIALGSNQGSSDDILQQACGELTSRGVRVQQMSEFLRSRPVGKDAGAEFVNAAVRAETQLSALETLMTLHEVEHLLGRKRTIHWGPRTLDLDLILFDTLVLNDAAITVPHPAMWYRHFVLKPAAEVAESMVHPILGLSTQELYERICRRPIVIELPDNVALQWAAEQARAEVLELQSASGNEPELQFVSTREGRPDRFSEADCFLKIVSTGDQTTPFQVVVPNLSAATELRQWLRDLFLAILG